MKKLSLVILSFLFLSNIDAQNMWTIDKAHSKISFTVAHMVISEVEGRFSEYSDSISAGDNFSDLKITLRINVSSISTDNEDRDKHLKSSDFFDIQKYPFIDFNSTKMAKVGDNLYKLYGNLTMHGVTKPVQLDVKYGGTVKDPWGNTKAGFKITGVIDRYAFGLKYNSTLETGALIVGQKVNVNAFIELKKNK